MVIEKRALHVFPRSNNKDLSSRIPREIKIEGGAGLGVQKQGAEICGFNSLDC